MTTSKSVPRETDIELSDVDCPCGQGKMAWGEKPADPDYPYPHEVYCQHEHENFELVLGVKARTRTLAQSTAKMLLRPDPLDL